MSVTIGTANIKYEKTGFDGGMISDGNFATGTPWVTATGFTITTGSPGYASYDDVGYAKLRQLESSMVSPILTNTNYTVEFDIAISSGTARIYIMDYLEDVEYVPAANYVNGHHSLNFTTPGYASDGITFEAGNTSSNTFTITNIKVHLT
jgi:hypothetical protein